MTVDGGGIGQALDALRACMGALERDADDTDLADQLAGLYAERFETIGEHSARAAAFLSSISVDSDCRGAQCPVLQRTGALVATKMAEVVGEHLAVEAALLGRLCEVTGRTPDEALADVFGQQQGETGA